jgi:hypothetical protein
MRRLWILLAAVAAVPVALWAADDLFTPYDMKAEQWEQAVTGIGNGYLGTPQIPAGLRALSGEQRAAFVTSLGGWARAYAGSDDFKKRYGKAYKQYQKSHGGGGGLGAALGGFGGLKRKAKAEAEQQAKSQATDAAGVTKAPDYWVPSEDPSVTIAHYLEHFLEVTKDVDFQAQLDGRRFANADYEKRDGWWKMCFRAGPEATAAARQVAGSWLADLKAQAPAGETEKTK